MTLQVINTPQRFPFGTGMGRLSSAIAFASTTAMSAANQYVAVFGDFWHKAGPGASKNISAIEFRWASTVTFNASTLRVGIQGVDTSASAGPPPRADGTFKGATNSAFADLTAGSASTWETLAVLGEVAAVTVGSPICVIFKVQAGTPTSLGISAVSNMFPSEASSFPITTRFDGTSTFAAQAVSANVALKCDDGSYGTLCGALVASAVSTNTYSSSSNPDEMGLYWVPPFKFAAAGGGAMGAFGTATSDGNINLYSDPLGSPSLLQSTSQPGEWGRGSASRFPLDRMFTASSDVAAGTAIGLVWEATAAGTVGTDVFDPPSTAIRDDIYAGVRLIGRQNGSGAFSEINSGLRIPLMWLTGWKLGDDAGGGGGSSDRRQSMTGGLAA